MGAGFDLDTPVGRRAVSAAVKAHCSDDPTQACIQGELRAALDVLLSDECQTCGGSGKKKCKHPNCTAINSFCPIPDCDNGRVKPAIPTWELVEATIQATMAGQVREDIRAEVIEEVKGWVGHWYSCKANHEGVGTLRQYIERRAAER